MLRYHIVLVLGLLIISVASAVGQEITVLPGDFYRDDKDLTARIEPVKNENAQTCALVKVITTETGFDFYPDGIGLCRDVEYRTSEIWLWLAPGTRRLTISHNQLGQLRDYEFAEVLQSATVYVMRLTTGRVHSVVQAPVRENWLALNVVPPEAAVKIDGDLVITHNGQFQKVYAVGQHTYEVFCDLYHPKRGTFLVGTDSTTALSVSLAPNYGYMKVYSIPEDDAAVFVDGRRVGTTPYASERLSSGNYTVQVAKELYRDASCQVFVYDGETTCDTISLVPDFALPHFVCTDPEAEIWVNGERKGIGSWCGPLPSGAYKVEARRPSHLTSHQSFTLSNGDSTEIVLPAPVPIFGQLNVSCLPLGADIYLDGKQVGTTPKLLGEVLVGQHTIVLEKKGYKSENLVVTVEEGKMASVEADLVKDIQKKQAKQPPISEQPLSKPRVTDNLLFTLKGAYSSLPQWAFGFRVGTTGKWGWNVSLMTNFGFKCFKATSPQEGDLLVLDKHKTTRLGVTAGVVVHPITSILLFLNAGYGYRGVAYHSLSDDSFVRYTPHCFHGAELSLGVMAHVKGLLLSVEMGTINFRYGEFKFGIGGLIKLKK